MALTDVFLALEKEPEPDERSRLLDEAFRTAHSLKGAARAVAFGAVEALGHGLEGVLEAARDLGLELSPTLFDKLYAVVDALGGAFGVDDVPSLTEADEQELVRQLGADEVSAPTAGPIIVTPPRPGAAPPLHRDGRGSFPSAAGETVRLPAARLDVSLEQLGGPDCAALGDRRS